MVKYLWLLALALTPLATPELRAQQLSDSVEFGTKSIDIQEVTVRASRKQYDRDSPAVRLVKRLIKSRDSLSPFRQHKNIEYQRYERIVISMDDFQSIDSTNSLYFLNQYTELNPKTGKVILPISRKERVLLSRLSRGELFSRDTLLYYNSQGVDDRFSDGTILMFINEMVPEVNIYDNFVYLAGRQLISPLATDAFNFYKYHLHPDTITYNGLSAVTLEFFPFSKHSLSMRGELTVIIDTLHTALPYVAEVSIGLPKTADANFIYNLSIEQQYRLDSSGIVTLEKDDINFDLSPMEAMPGLNLSRLNIYSGYDFSPKDKTPTTSHYTFDDKELQSYYKFTGQDKEIAKVTKLLRERNLWTLFEEALLIFTEGYYQTGKKSYFDIGPIPKFLTGNSVEGTRLALGGMTTPNLSKHLFFDGLVAYGFSDSRWKVDLSLEWSFIPKKVIYKEFPIHSLRATYSNDIHKFGENFDLANTETVLSWAKRSGDLKLTYVELFQLRYAREWENNMSLMLYARNYNTSQSSNFSFLSDPLLMPSYRMTEFEVRWRYAPGEKLYQTRRSRRNLNKYIPTFELSHSVGIKGLLDGQYSQNITELSAMGRINLQPLGYADVKGAVAVEWNEVPYMLLPHPKTNLTYFSGNISSFSLMLPLEFLYDRSAYLGVDYHLDGLITSRIPLIKHLNLREIITFRAIYGELSDKNNPQLNSSLLPFPQGAKPIGYAPYMELGVGVDNILSFFKIEYVWRLNYLTPGTSSGAILFDFYLQF